MPRKPKKTFEKSLKKNKTCLFSSPEFTCHLPLMLSILNVVMLQVLNLQLAVENLVAWSEKLKRNVTLQDICLQPLFPDNKKCAVMSVLNYFQNNATNLDIVRGGEYFEAADYLSHLMICAK